MPELKRDVNLPRATIYGVGQILGAGIYAILGEAAGRTGESIGLSFLLAALIASCTGLSYAELVSRYPKAAGDYVYVRHAFDNELLAEFTAVSRLLVGIIAAATVALAFAGYLASIVTVPLVPTAIALLVLLSVINFWGIDFSTRLNVVFTGISVLGLLLIIWIGIGEWTTVNVFQTSRGLTGLVHASFLIFFAYVGFEDVVNIAEETQDPTTVIPRAIVLAIVITTTIYLMVAFSAVAVVEWDVLGQSASPLALVAQTGFGSGSALLLAVIALFATTNTALINLISTSRVLYGVSKSEYQVFPTIFSRVHSTRDTPYIAIALIGMAALPFTVIGDLGDVAELANLAMLTLFALVNVALLKLRVSDAEPKPAFRAPLNVGRISLTALVGLLSAVGLIVFYLSQLL